jgi:hypothetical protein
MKSPKRSLMGGKVSTGAKGKMGAGFLDRLLERGKVALVLSTKDPGDVVTLK